MSETETRSGEPRRIDIASEPPFSLGEMQVRPPSREVVLAGKSQIVQPRVMQVLVALGGRRGEVVSRDELIARCWRGLAVSEDAINRCIAQLRRLAEETGAFAIDTVARVGYRLMADGPAPNRDASGRLQARSSDTDDSQHPPEAVLQRPAVAILPFLNLSGDPAQEYFADGVTEDLITALSAWRWFPVIARNSTFAFKGRPVDVVAIGKELGVRYVVEGSIRRSADRVRITAQLIDAGNAHHLWAQSFDREIGDVFALQDEITRAIVGAVEPQLTRAEQQRAQRKLPENLDAWDLSLQGLALIRKGTTGALAEADRVLVRAVALDRNSSYAQSLLALARWHAAIFGWTADPVKALAATYEAAREAVDLDDHDWLAHALLGIAALWNRGAYDQAVAEEEIAIALNPSAALAYHLLGCVITFNSQPDLALPKYQAVLQLDPRFQFLSTVFADIGLSHFLLGDFPAAIQFYERSIGEQRGNVRAWQRLAAALGAAGRTEEAKSALAQVLKLQPELTRSYIKTTYPFRDESHTRMLENGLRQAGWSG